MRSVNDKLLSEWLKNNNGISGLEKDSGVSLHTIYKMANGYYQSEPKRLTRKAICDATGLMEDDLFPVV